MKAEEALEAETGLSVTWADGSEAPATLIGRDPSTDVALLRVEGATPPPTSLGGSPAAVGELAPPLGRGPEGPLAALGIVGALGPAWRSLRGGRIDALIWLDLRLPAPRRAASSRTQRAGRSAWPCTGRAVPRS